jgi:hypothetical protein
MGCNCNAPSVLTSWIDLESYPPRNPLELIAKAQIVIGGNTDVGAFISSAVYGNPGVPWTANTFAITGLPVCVALESDNQQKVADGQIWNFQHITWDGAVRIVPQLQRLVFLRGGDDAWQMNIPINLGGGLYPKLELSFLDNCGTRGDYAGTYPVISWTARNYTGAVSLQVTLKQFGRVRLGIMALDNGGNYSMFDFEAMIVA